MAVQAFKGICSEINRERYSPACGGTSFSNCNGDDVDFERGIITLKGPKSGKTENIPVSMKAWTLNLPLCSPVKTVSKEPILAAPGNGYGRRRTCRRGSGSMV